MSVTRNLPCSAALPRRRYAWHQAALASGALAAVTLLSVGCGGSQTYVEHIQHACPRTIPSSHCHSNRRRYPWNREARPPATACRMPRKYTACRDPNAG